LSPVIAGVAVTVFFGWLLIVSGILHLAYAWQTGVQPAFAAASGGSYATIRRDSSSLVASRRTHGHGA
jgi:hypothetical protein